MDAYTAFDQLSDGCSDNLPTSTERPYIEYPRTIEVKGQTAEELNSCQWATSVVEENRATGQSRLRRITCKRWRCPPCSRQKIRDLAQWIKLAVPNKLLTLTVDPKRYKSPEDAWLNTAVRVPELIRALRKRFGPIEFLRVVETTERGWPHYHLIVRSGYLPQPVIKQLWEQLTGSQIVDIREVKQFFNSFQYLVKYLTKLREVPWTDRRVTYSRNFFPVSITPEPQKTEWRITETIPLETYAYLEETFHGRRLTETAPGTYLLPLRPPTWIPPSEKTADKPIVQKNMGW